MLKSAKTVPSESFRNLQFPSGRGRNRGTANLWNGTLIGNQGMAPDGRSVSASLRVGTLRPLPPTTSPCAGSKGTKDSNVKERRNEQTRISLIKMTQDKRAPPRRHRGTEARRCGPVQLSDRMNQMNRMGRDREGHGTRCPQVSVGVRGPRRGARWAVGPLGRGAVRAAPLGVHRCPQVSGGFGAWSGEPVGR